MTLKAGLEIHQQLNSGKLFCNCGLSENGKDVQFKRKLHATSSELGDVFIVSLFSSEYITSQSKWEKEHKLPEKITGELYNRVLGEGSFEVLNIARKLGLPPPFKIEVPQVKMGGNKNIKPSSNSPEIA